MFLRIFSSCILAASAASACAQTADPSYATAAELTAIVSQAKAKISPDTPFFNTPTLHANGYTVVTEYHSGPGLASVHDAEAEFMYVVDGEATFVMGGTLLEAKRTNPTNQTGTGIHGGVTHQARKGDMILVPMGAPHFWSAVKAPITVVTLHVPAPK
jgi:mannose-6-phosphate isomerase-like protein (cupin superfamily)